MIGYLLAIFIGLSLGILGGGGSILTVPILVYILKMDPKTSVALSLFIVGVTASIGVYMHFKQKNIDLKVASIFAPIAMIGTFAGAKLSQLLTGQIQLFLFAIIMLLASFFMLKNSFSSNNPSTNTKKQINIPMLIVQAVAIGIITGVVGVGGGFLIVPALVLLTGPDIKKAVGTSLLIIALNSLSGFIGYLDLIEVPWKFLSVFSLLSCLGVFAGVYLIKFIPQLHLKRGFAVFLIIMGFFILYQNKEVLLT